MKVLTSTQQAGIGDPVGAKYAMLVPVMDATLHSLKLERVKRLGGHDRITLADLAREYREGTGDAGICFEFAVHQAIAQRHGLIYPIVAEALGTWCKLKGGPESIFFGPEKEGRIPILETASNSLTDDSSVYLGQRGRPPKLKQYIPRLMKAFRDQGERQKLPRSITGLWKADLFVGTKEDELWVGTSIKINESHLEGAPGLRIGIYPKTNSKDVPRLDEDMNLIRLPLPYDNGFMELFYKTFFLFRAFLHADAMVPAPIELPDAQDRYITDELKQRREHPVKDLLDVFRRRSQPDLVKADSIAEVAPTKGLSVEEAIVAAEGLPVAESISITPEPIKK